MADAGTLEVQTETRGGVPEDVVSFAVRRVSSLLRMASEPVLFARVKLTMHADPAVERPAIAQVNVDLNGRLVRAQAADETMRAAVEHACDRLRIRLERAARNWAAAARRPAAARARRVAPREHARAAAAVFPPPAGGAHRDAAQVLHPGPRDSG